MQGTALTKILRLGEYLIINNLNNDRLGRATKSTAGSLVRLRIRRSLPSWDLIVDQTQGNQALWACLVR